MDIQSTRLAHAETVQEDNHTLAGYSQLAGKNYGTWDDLCTIWTSWFPMESAQYPGGDQTKQCHSGEDAPMPFWIQVQR